jgi:hypothetical protein
MASILTFLSGKKTYLTALAGVITTLVAYLDKTLTLAQFVAAIWVIAQTVFIRAGVNAAATAAITKMLNDTSAALQAPAPTVNLKTQVTSGTATTKPV